MWWCDPCAIQGNCLAIWQYSMVCILHHARHRLFIHARHCWRDDVPGLWSPMATCDAFLRRQVPNLLGANVRTRTVVDCCMSLRNTKKTLCQASFSLDLDESFWMNGSTDFPWCLTDEMLNLAKSLPLAALGSRLWPCGPCFPMVQVLPGTSGWEDRNVYILGLHSTALLNGKAFRVQFASDPTGFQMDPARKSSFICSEAVDCAQILQGSCLKVLNEWLRLRQLPTFRWQLPAEVAQTVGALRKIGHEGGWNDHPMSTRLQPRIEWKGILGTCQNRFKICRNLFKMDVTWSRWSKWHVELLFPCVIAHGVLKIKQSKLGDVHLRSLRANWARDIWPVRSCNGSGSFKWVWNSWGYEYCGICM
jgi:hypothetical protein